MSITVSVVTPLPLDYCVIGCNTRLTKCWLSHTSVVSVFSSGFLYKHFTSPVHLLPSSCSLLFVRCGVSVKTTQIMYVCKCVCMCLYVCLCACVRSCVLRTWHIRACVHIYMAINLPGSPGP